MSKFKKDQIVYVSDDKVKWKIAHFIEDREGVHRYKVSAYSSKFNKDNEGAFYLYCISVEEFESITKKPNDKDLVWAWAYDKNAALRTAGFYDALNNCLFHSSGNREGAAFINCEVIPREQWPEWAVKAYNQLED